MNRLGIETGLDLRAQTLRFLQRHFGKSGPHYYWFSRGVDERPVRADRVRKSVGAENTFSQDLHAYEPMREALEPIIAKVWRYCQATAIRGADCDTEGEVRRLSADHTKQVRRRRHRPSRGP